MLEDAQDDTIPDESIEDPGDDSDDEPMTAQIALQKVENAWLNEKFAPEILPQQSELVECMLQQIEHIEENLKRLDKSDLRYTVHTLELSRIKYIISSYLRIRLEKIERFVHYILAEEEKHSLEEDPYLTPGELQFAQEYANSIEKLFKNIALKHLPEAYNQSKYIIKPNLNIHVFLKVKKTVNGIIIPGTEDTEIDLEAGSQHIIQYKAIAHLVKDGSVQLI